MIQEAPIVEFESGSPAPGRVRCLTCGLHFPAYYIQVGQCADCRMVNRRTAGVPAELETTGVAKRYRHPVNYG